jgi:molybdate transport system substrate-binding protein
MRFLPRFFLVALGGGGLVAAEVPAREAPLLVSAAASLRGVLTECAAERAKAWPEEPGVVFNFGASGALAAQIKNGAPVAVFIAAGERPMAQVVAAGLAEAGAVRRFVGNRLVLVAPAGSVTPRGWAELASAASAGGVRHLALGESASVPAGAYAEEVLKTLGQWEALEGRRVLAKDVRQVLAYVERGDAEAGVVYATDAAAAPQVRVVAEAPEGAHAPITYPAVVLAGAPGAEAARAWLKWIEGAQARAIFARHGFVVAAAEREGGGE